MRCYALVLLLPASLAFQLPFKVPFFTTPQTRLEVVESSVVESQRVAIIGAGAGGSSAAFWISKAKERFGVDVEVDVYERQDYIGGRSIIVHPYGNSSLPALELGASIFVEANKNLWRASNEFNFTRKSFRDSNGGTGIWDGKEIILSLSDGWWDTVKVLWRYGIFSPRRTQSIVSALVDRYLILYTPGAPKWDNIFDLASSLGWLDLIANSTDGYLSAQGVSKEYTHELIEGATRVNYGQNVVDIHALEGLICMATDRASSIRGGNYQIFEQFLNRSGAKVYLNAQVNSISQKSSSSHIWTVKSTQGAADYKAVILAAPFHSSNITLPPSLSAQIPEQPYVHLHVTLLTTTSPTPDPTYFSLPPSSDVPSMMLTTYEGVRKGGEEPEFNSLSYLGLVRDAEWAVKIFSKERITDEWLKKMFFGKVGWVYRKEWDAYPKLPPTTSFPPVKLDRGLYYVNAFEPFISTMETETIASRNVVDLLLNEEFNSGICGSRISASETTQYHTSEAADFVLGWDC